MREVVLIEEEEGESERKGSLETGREKEVTRKESLEEPELSERWEWIMKGDP